MNIFGRRADWLARRRLLRETVARLDPGLVAFQEAVVTVEYDQVADVLGDGMHLLHQRDREPGGPADVEAGQGISIAPRWPIVAGEEVDINVAPRTDGGPTLRIASCERVLDWPEDGVWASDHFGLTAELEPLSGVRPKCHPPEVPCP